jgi:hypothetical protein
VKVDAGANTKVRGINYRSQTEKVQQDGGQLEKLQEMPPTHEKVDGLDLKWLEKLEGGWSTRNRFVISGQSIQKKKIKIPTRLDQN